MELPGIVYPPNRPLEEKSYMKVTQNPNLYDYLFYIDANKNGELIVGSSSITNNYWEGSLFHYKNYEAAKSNVYTSYYSSNSTTSDAKFLQDDCVLLAEDNGNLKILILPSETSNQFMECRHTYDKEYRVQQLTIWNANRFATCTEYCINLYDINESSIQLDRTFKNYHTDKITSIDSIKSEENLFLSTSFDRKACIWDVRMPIPATVIYNNEFSSLTSVSWNPVNSDYVIIGSEAGDIYLLNIKQPKDVLSASRCFDASVFRTSFNDSESLAVCGNITYVLLYSCQKAELEKYYENTEHSSIVRGLTWYKDDWYSCGFDKKILIHHS